MLSILTIRRAPGNFSPWGGVLKLVCFVKAIEERLILCEVMYEVLIVLGTWACCQDAIAG
jgi:hypothetical protein